MIKKGKIFLLAAVLLLALTQVAFPALKAVGPVIPDTDPGPGWSAGYNGFPTWYRDKLGVTVELPNPPIGDGVNAPTIIFDPVDPLFPFSAQIGFGTEAMWWDGGARMTMPAGPALPAGGQALLVMAVEAAFDQGDAIDRTQITFSRIRIRIDCPDAGTYIVTHPYGQKQFVVAAGGIRAINDTVDIGVTPGVFTGALAGAIGPFLKQVNPAPAPGWIGDGNTAVVPGDPGSPGATVTGSPNNRNFFRVQGPGGLDVRTNLFTVNALEFRGTPFDITRATFTRTAGVTNAEVFAQVPAPVTAGTILTASIGGAPPVPMTQSGVFFFTRIPFNAALPTQVTVNGTTGGLKPTTLNKNLVDLVQITKATYAIGANLLTIAAISTDDQAVLQATGWGAGKQPLLAGGADTTFNPANATPPLSIGVSSSLGGAKSTPVVVLP